MTNKLVVIINSLEVPKIKKILLYEMKFLVPSYSCLQNLWLGGYRPQIPVLSVLCPQMNLLTPPPPKKIPECATGDGTRWRTGGEVKGKLANGMGSQYPSHYPGTWCIQHYYQLMRTPRLPVVDWTDAPGRFKWTRSVSPKDEIWFLRVCHHISNTV